MTQFNKKSFTAKITVFLTAVFLPYGIFSQSFAQEKHNGYSRYGKIIESYSGKDLREAIIVTDAHCNLEAQKNIASIIGQYCSNDENGIVAIEGASGELTLDDIKSFPIKEPRNKVTDYFLKQGKINGAEYYFITRETKNPDSLFVGAEKPQEYLRNYNLYINFSAGSQKAQETLKPLMETVQEIADSRFDMEQKNFDSLHQSLYEKNIGFLQYCKYLIELAGKYDINLDNYKSLKNLNEIFADEKKIDTIRLETERKYAHKLLCAKDGSLNAIYDGLKLGKTDASTYYLRLESAGKTAGFDFNGYPHLATYIRYINATEKINHNEIFLESIRLSDTLSEKIFPPGENARVYRLSRNLRMVSKLFSLDLSSYEYALLIKENISSADISDLISKLYPEKKDLLTCESAGDFDRYLKESFEFYHCASDRNKFIVDNVLADMDIEGCDSVCLIVGGFHAQGIKDILREKGISYTVISPNMSDSGHADLYKSRLANEKTEFEKVLEESFARINAQDRSSICVNSSLAIASMLADESLIGDENGLKAFRDEYKTLMLIDSIMEFEKGGVYSIAELKKQVDNLIINVWGKKNFTGLDDLRIYRDLSGKLIVQVSIGNTRFSFFSYDGTTLSQFNPKTDISKFEIGNLNIAVLPNSVMEHEKTHVAADALLRKLYDTPISLNRIKQDLGIDSNNLDLILDKWSKLGYITRDSDKPDSVISLTGELKAVIPFALELFNSKISGAGKFDSAPESVKNNLAALGVTQINISEDISFPVAVDFLFKLAKPLDDIHGLYPQAPVIFSLFGEDKIFYASVEKQGSALTGNAIELKSAFYQDKPFDQTVRNDKLGEIYSNPDVIAEILNTKNIQHDTVQLKPVKRSIRNLVPFTDQARMEDDVTRKLFSFIGDPDKFDQVPKALVFDLDGTLSERDATGFKPIPDEIITEMKKFIAKGIKIAVISGQEHQIVKERFLNLFDKSEWPSITIYSNSGATSIGYDENSDEIEYRRLTLENTIPGFSTADFMQKLRKLAADLNIEEYTVRTDPCQISLRFEKADPETRIKFHRKVLKLIEQSNLPLKAALAGMYTIDIAALDKSNAVSHYINHVYKTEPRYVMFFGDSYNGNDAPMAEAAPDSPHFHVGEIIQDMTIPENVTALDGKGPVSTLYVLNKLSFLLDSTIDKRINKPALRNILRANNLYFDFLKSRSELTAPDKLTDLMSLPIWFATNEDNWEQAIPQIEKGGFDDVFIGISASGVNLSYIAAAKPSMAVIVDLNPLITQLFMPLRNALIGFAGNRIEYLSLLSGKPVRQFVKDGIKYYALPKTAPGEEPIILTENASLEQIYELFSRAPFSEKYAKNVADIICGFMPEELQDAARRFWEYQTQPFNQGFKHMQMLKTMISADSRAKGHVTWLSDEKRFKYIKQFVSDGKLLAVESSWSAENVASLSAFLTSQGKKASLIYLSNVHHKIPSKPAPDGSNEYFNYLSNIASLPKTDNALILSDQTLKNSPFDSISTFVDSRYQASLEHFIKNYINMLGFSPDSDTAEQSLARRNMYVQTVSDIMAQAGKDNLAGYYDFSNIAQRREILNAFSQSVFAQWNSLKDKIRRNQPLTSDENQLAMELTYLLGYGLKDMDKITARYKSPFDFLFDILNLPYSKGQVFLPRTIAELKSGLIKTVEIYRLEPDIVLLDSSMLTSPSSTANMAVGQTIETFRTQHIQRYGRRPVFVAVDASSGNVIDSKRDLDRKLFTRGDDSAKFDFVMATGFNPKNAEHTVLYEKIKTDIGEDNLKQMAKSALLQENVTTPSADMLKTKMDGILMDEFKKQIIKKELTDRLGISESSLSARTYVISAQDSILKAFADSTGSSFRPVETTREDDLKPASAGVFLIDILNSIGDEELPANLVIHGIKKDIALTSEEKNLKFDTVLSLFIDIYNIYSGLAQKEKPELSVFLNSVAQARLSGAIGADKSAMMISPDEIESLLEAELGKTLHPDSLVRVFMVMVKPRWTVHEKNMLRNQLTRQHKILRLDEIISAKLAVEKDGIPIKSIEPELRKTNLNISDVASYLQVTIPPRPVSGELNNAITRQRSLDESA